MARDELPVEAVHAARSACMAERVTAFPPGTARRLLRSGRAASLATRQSGIGWDPVACMFQSPK
ncbi:hypothetical protein, partial [Frateuria sp. Soil773]|uniref:hypothetical protein n=1 Tax=Frateuria sp. Soil773 TaxID=1736407 RepID=UPI001F311FB7